ncbi:hypothetical protein JT05_10180 [Desulfosporosinus sp. Tol-M]|nr:hypothetical protein JT05_10180 [Desulfosporosinus sp. Tol-M]
MIINKITKNILSFFLIVFVAMFVFGCGTVKQTAVQTGGVQEPEKKVLLSGDGLTENITLTLQEMLQLPEAKYEHLYSTINSWPTPKIYAARGIKLEEIFKAAGLKKEAKCFTFKGAGNYQCSFTREQLLETPRFYFPGILKDDPAGAEQVKPIIAYEYRENCNTINKITPEELTLIMPQAYLEEQTNYAFVKDIKEITITTEDPGKWEAATAFPLAGKIAKGETVKLQHKYMDNVRIYYTLDGSTPTEKSMLYNPSTFQPELNKPILLEKDTTLKVLAKGFGKYDSETAIYNYQIK